MFVQKIVNGFVSLVLALAVINTTCVFPPVSNINTEESNPTSTFENYYYYNQLNDNEKRLYNDLKTATTDFLNGKKVILTITNYDVNNKKGYIFYYQLVKRVLYAYTFDNPEAVIWLENYNRTYYIADQKDYVYMELTPKSASEETSSLNAENIQDELNKLRTKATDFVKTLTGTDKEKITQIHNWLIENVSYDTTISVPDRDNPYGPIMKGQAICSGYSYAFKYLADLAGLEVIYVVGKVHDPYTGNFESHAWNLACIEDEWFLVDVTSDENAKDQYLLSPIDNKMHFPETYFNFIYPK